MKKIVLLAALFASGLSYAQSVLEQEIFNELNRWRAKHNLSRVVDYSDELQRAARHHAKYLHLVNVNANMWSQQHYFGHDEERHLANYPRYSFKKRCELIQENGVSVLGEICHMGLIDAKGIMQAFYNSPGHRAIMLGSVRNQVVGISHVEGYTVIVFGKE